MFNPLSMFLPKLGEFNQSFGIPGLSQIIKAGTGIASGLIGGHNARRDANASRDAFNTNEANRVDADRTAFGDTERLRTSRAGAIGEKLADTKYNIPAEFLNELQTDKEFTGFAREAPEVQGSFFNDLLGGITGQAQSGVNSYLLGLGAGDPNATPDAPVSEDVKPTSLVDIQDRNDPSKNRNVPQ